MATEAGEDPNEDRMNEAARGKDHPDLTPDEEWGENQNPVRETPVPFGGLSDGGSGAR